MKIHKRLYLFFATVLILSLLVVGSAAAKSPNKVDICHNNGNGSYTLVKVKASDLQAHLAHGDAAPGDAVPGQAGKVLSAKCAVVSTAPDAQFQTPAKPLKANNGKKADKVDVCHRTGNGSFHLINISGNALPAHLAHGDGLPGELISGTHTKFDSNCSLVVVPQLEVFQRFTINSEISVPVTSTAVLELGVQYEIVVTGTYTYVVNGQADAEYSWIIGGLPVKDLGATFFPNILDLTINGCAADNNTEWGAYTPSHVYTLPWTGTGEKISFVICDVYYKDNKGSLEVTIYKKNW